MSPRDAADDPRFRETRPQRRAAPLDHGGRAPLSIHAATDEALPIAEPWTAEAHARSLGAPPPGDSAGGALRRLARLGPTPAQCEERDAAEAKRRADDHAALMAEIARGEAAYQARSGVLVYAVPTEACIEVERRLGAVVNACRRGDEAAAWEALRRAADPVRPAKGAGK